MKQREERGEDNYHFDEVPPEDYIIFETPVEKEEEQYVVQIGAFSSLDKAKQFADFSRLKLQKDIIVNFNDRNNFYVVQIHPSFKSRSEAEQYRNELWKYDEYKDAWIVVIRDESGK